MSGTFYSTHVINTFSALKNSHFFLSSLLSVIPSEGSIICHYIIKYLSVHVVFLIKYTSELPLTFPDWYEILILLLSIKYSSTTSIILHCHWCSCFGWSCWEDILLTYFLPSAPCSSLPRKFSCHKEVADWFFIFVWEGQLHFLWINCLKRKAAFMFCIWILTQIRKLSYIWLLSFQCLQNAWIALLINKDSKTIMEEAIISLRGEWCYYWCRINKTKSGIEINYLQCME